MARMLGELGGMNIYSSEPTANNPALSESRQQ
jgi:hypothetical protein